MVTDAERDYLWNIYASDRRARLNLGIRRRLAPLLQRDRRRIELMNGLLLSMPGTPVIYYGDEIGMGDNVHLGDRDGVRTPMQWTEDRNGGFSRADPASMALPPIMDPLYGYAAVNVEAQTRDQHSLLNWMRRMLTLRRNHKVFGRGTLRFLYPRNRRILAYLREYDDETVLCIANLARTPQAVELDLSAYAGRVPVEMTGPSPFPPIGQLNYQLTLPPYAFYWFELRASGEAAPSWRDEPPEQLPEFQTLGIDALPDMGQAPIRWLATEQSNSSLIIGNVAMIKLIRRISPGVHPEAEMTRRLTFCGFANTAAASGRDRSGRCEEHAVHAEPAPPPRKSRPSAASFLLRRT